MQSVRTARFETQRVWNYFALVVTIPKDVEETILSLTEDTRSSHGTIEIDKLI
jgi:hypothetical protein